MSIVLTLAVGPSACLRAWCEPNTARSNGESRQRRHILRPFVRAPAASGEGSDWRPHARAVRCNREVTSQGQPSYSGRALGWSARCLFERYARRVVRYAVQQRGQTSRPRPHNGRIQPVHAVRRCAAGRNRMWMIRAIDRHGRAARGECAITGQRSAPVVMWLAASCRQWSDAIECLDREAEGLGIANDDPGYATPTSPVRIR